jgi:glutamate formiminotransferase/formiminotetrahydrofolate cyclodeaminase
VESLEDYAERLASAAPTPGGGSAATIVGAFAAALVAMVARLTRAEASAALAERADALRRELLAAREADERAFAAVVAAQALPRSTEAEENHRSERLQAALAHAAAEPLRAAELGLDVLRLAESARATAKRALASDLGCATAFAGAAVRASALNVRVNHHYMKDAALVAAQETRLREILGESAAAEARAAAE